MNKKIELPYKFECRPYQIPTWEALMAGKKRIVCCWHRGAGKDLFALNYFIYRMVKYPAVYLHCFPQYSQGKKAIWNSVHKTDDGESVSYLEHFPEELIKYKNSQEMRIELVNGSIYCVMGIDGKNAQLARGMNPTHVIVSEYAYMDPQSWYTIEPRVIANDGTVMFLSTPNGKNHFYDLYNYAASNRDPNFFSSFVSNDDTKIVSDDQLKHMRDEGRPEDFIQQEVFCDFNRGAQGSYYGALIQEVRNEGRICNLNVHPDLPCHTAWDLGIRDATSIFIFQILKNGTINILHFYENAGVGLDHYARYLDDWKAKKKAVWGVHYAPHDAKQNELNYGIERCEVLRQLGYPLQILPKKNIADGIQTVRALLPHCCFNESETKWGLKCLDMYRKKWNDSLKVYYDEPLHDQHSHAADSFRYLAMGIKMFPPETSRRLSADEITQMRIKYYGY